MAITHEQVTQALRDVFDPELGMSVVELGLIYDIAIVAGQIRITMTLTTQGCPLHAAMADWVRQAVGKIPGVDDVVVAITFEPPWTPERIGQDALLARPSSRRRGDASH
jgi:metal-sulfur cluster biosynthetic enzyme